MPIPNNLFDINELVMNTQPLDRPVLTNRIWLVCLSQCVKNYIHSIEELANEYTYASDFYKNDVVLSAWLRQFKFEFTGNDVFCMSPKVISVADVQEYPLSQIKEELFYTFKNKESLSNITPSAQYFLTYAYKQKHIPYSRILEVLPENVFEDIVSGEMGDPAELITAVTGEKYPILTADKPYAVRGDIAEIYIAANNAVITAPKYLLSKIPTSSIENIHFDGKFFTLENTPLHSLLGKEGTYVGEMGITDLVNCL